METPVVNSRLKLDGSGADVGLLVGGLSADCKVPSGVFCTPAMFDDGVFASKAGSTVVP